MGWAQVKVLLALTFYYLVCFVNSEEVATDNVTSIAKPDIYELHVVTNIQFRYATTTVSSRVANPANVSQEIGFTVVLPETGFISEFLMVIKGKEYKAYVNEKEKAKKTYDDAVSQGLGAAYVEQKARDSNQFRVSVNIEPFEKVNFILKYEELLSRTLGFYNQVININPGQIVKNMSVVVNIKEASNITKVEVPKLQTSNDVTPEAGQNPLATIDWKSSQLVTVTYAPTPEQQEEISKKGIDGQLTVKYDVDRGNSQQILVNDGYFVHFYAPDNLKPLPKHVVFVLDYSGSMLGKKIEQLKEAMAIILSDLSPKDFFSLVLFSDVARSWSPSDNQAQTPVGYNYYGEEDTRPQELGMGHIVPVTPENILAAKSHINTYNDFGSTNIIGGLRDGLRLVDIGSELFKNSAVPPEPMIIFLTDGEPNVELSDPEEIIKKVKELNTKRVAIFSLAFGYGADFKFLRKLSLRNNAFARTIYEGGDATAQLKNFYKEVASPLLSNITFDYLPDPIDNETSTRCKFPAFYYGSEIVVAGKLNSDENGSYTEDIEVGKLIARGRDGNHEFPIIIPGPFPLPVPRPVKKYTIGTLEKVWAYLNIQQLLDKIDTLTQEAEIAAIKNKALTLALKYQFVTELTSMVVVKPNETKAVDTEQVRPGSPNWQSSGVYSSNPIQPMAIPRSSYNYAAHSYQMPLSISSSFKSRPGVILGARGESGPDLADDVFESEPDSSVEPVTKVAIENLTWLANYTNSDNSTVTLPLDSGDTVFKLGVNEPDISYGNCQLPGTNTTGECRHLQYCALQTYEQDLSSFLPYRCDILNGFLGTCCPVS